MAFSTTEKVEQAARNNALWCDAMCCSHDCPGEFREAGWLNFKPTPPFYPNAVTLGGVSQTPFHHGLVYKMVDAGLAGEWAIKDSFQTLDLNTLGFQILFESQWIYQSATHTEEAHITGVSWDTVTTASALDEWERAWAGESDIEGLFVPRLLRKEDVRIIAARRAGQIVAGCVTNLAAGCVGISNIFLPSENAQEFRRGCIAKVQSSFPGLPMVGYESGADLVGMEDVGFAAIGGLRVWLWE